MDHRRCRRVFILSSFLPIRSLMSTVSGMSFIRLFAFLPARSWPMPRLNLDPSIYIPATLLGGGLALASHGTKAAARIGANLSPEPVSNWVLSIVEDVIAFAGTLLAVFAPVCYRRCSGCVCYLLLLDLPEIRPRGSQAVQRRGGIFPRRKFSRGRTQGRLTRNVLDF